MSGWENISAGELPGRLFLGITSFIGIKGGGSNFSRKASYINETSRLTPVAPPTSPNANSARRNIRGFDECRPFPRTRRGLTDANLHAGLKPTQSRETSPLRPSTPTYLLRRGEEAREEDYGEGVREEEHTRERGRESENKMFQGQKKRR